MHNNKSQNLLPRPPIVVILGHVDHGKTTLLDCIRKTNIAKEEVGAITQSIGAYEIKHVSTQIYTDKNSDLHGRKITFIDTPGHETFSKMRAYGAKTADIAILIIAADDGVQPQTKDAINHIQNAKIPFIVTINKIDLPNANVEKVKQQLAEIGVFLEGYGGNVSWQAISAKNGQGVNELLDLILLAAELENLKYNPEVPAEGIILAARVDSRRGNTVIAIVKNGKLKTGQAIATATAIGKIKALENFLGEKTTELEPSAPAIIYGFEKLPQVGEKFYTGENKISFIDTDKTKNIANISEISEQIGENSRDKIKLILRAEEYGSLEALEELIKKLSSVLPLTVINSEIGNIYEKEIKFAVSAGALIIGFKTKIDRAAKNLIKGQDVVVITSDIIYDLEKIIRNYIEKNNTVIKGVVEVVATFGERKGKNQIVVGGRVIEGIVENKSSFEINRGEKKVGEGRILNLQSQKRDVSRAETGQEVGLLIESETAIAVGDKIIFR